jgi:hypothetical protein
VQKLKDHSTSLRDELLSKRPATPLPWVYERTSFARHADSGNILEGDGLVLEGGDGDLFRQIVHEHNAYRMGLSFLRGIDPVDSHAYEKAQALLRSLGEIDE